MLSVTSLKMILRSLKAIDLNMMTKQNKSNLKTR